MHIEVPSISAELLTSDFTNTHITSEEIKQRVKIALEVQQQRNSKPNSALGNNEVKEFCLLDNTCSKLIKTAIEKFSLSARSYYRILKVARTIADLDSALQIQLKHLQEALGYRSKLGVNA